MKNRQNEETEKLEEEFNKVDTLVERLFNILKEEKVTFAEADRIVRSVDRRIRTSARLGN